MSPSTRAALPGDAAVLAGLRLEFMRIVKDSGIPDEEAWRRGLTAYFARGLGSGKLRAWLCVAGGEAVASSALRIDPVRPGRGPAGTRDGYVMSIYTKPAFRGRGIARSLMETLIAEARSSGLRRLVLNPTDDGRPLYASLGFKSFRTVMLLDLAQETQTD